MSSSIAFVVVEVLIFKVLENSLIVGILSPISQFLYKNRSEVVYDPSTKEHSEKYYFVYPETPD